MLNIKELKVKKGDNIILDIDKVYLGENKSIGIWGENGAGKSTLVKCILGIEDYEGVIDINIDKSNVQVIMQSNNYPAYAKVKDVILLILDIKTLDSVMDFIKYIDFETCLEKEIGVLSAGEYQKLNLVLVLSLKPTLLIVDEVTTGLDYSSRNKIIEYIKSYISEFNCGFLIISHYKEELERLTTKTIILDKGHIIDICDSDKISESIGGIMNEAVE
ncbi:ATP-binding cassette domain-containing protein [Clostridium sp.]|uniref:ATP-binding cassette domain-containing protein n=1 Tax=Clostridium sp. TaxID=1506 RepID=UPI00290A1A5D|nr:ATP-binding cassette domain-containing protein [Clostridium sp.]MDU7005650.1 ATP-binding cassette domain-containing protein [Clostridium sp.]MDU7068019.1 ATP-binding cassette domain-containing protein [Clostridium perfringens]